MANYHSSQVNEETEEGNISLEDQAAQQDEAAKERNQTIETSSTEEQPTEERPEWLDEKFKTPEDMAKAYNELQKKLSQDSPKEEEETADKEVEQEEAPQVEEKAADNAVSKASEEYAKQGQLSDDTYGDLEKAGITRDMVDAYIQGQQSLATQQEQQIMSEVGGSDNYSAMTAWASENLSEGEQAAYDSMVTGGSPEQAKMAVKGLYSQYVASGGQSPQLMQGGTSGSSTLPFRSTAQVTEAMRDPRYSSDPAFRADVEKRLAVSNIL